MLVFVGFTELVINDGEFVKPINDPTVQGNSGESRGTPYTNLVDGKVLTSYKAEKNKVSLSLPILVRPNRRQPYSPVSSAFLKGVKVVCLYL